MICFNSAACAFRKFSPTFFEWRPRKVVEDRKRRLGPYAASGQLQQSPVTRGGNIIKREWWRLWPEDAPEAGLLDPIYYCPLCKWHQQIRERVRRKSSAGVVVLRLAGTSLSRNFRTGC